MPVYNGERYLRQAIESILRQTFADFEFVIINDGSVDATEAIIQSYDDPRIRYFSQSNHGLVYSLNRAIALSAGVYIARMDADDISAPTRLARALEIFESRPKTAVVGAAIIRIDETGKELSTEYYLANDTELREELALGCPFAHGSVVMRKDLFQQAGGYRQEFWTAEDYDLWRRMADVGELANGLEPLYFYRENPGGVTGAHVGRMQETAARIAREVLEESRHPRDIPLKRCLASYQHASPEARAAATARLIQDYFHISIAHARRGRIFLAAYRLVKLFVSAPAGLSFAFHRAVGALYERPHFLKSREHGRS